jgi:hypothetical protein
MERRAELAAEFGLRVRYREPRSSNWVGPASGVVFDDATKLRVATNAECEAGFLASWGYALSVDDREAFTVTLTGALPSYLTAIEAEAREIYSRLQAAIRDASSFAEQRSGSDTPAAAVLCELFGQLPALPQQGDLPGYAKTQSARARLVDQWQRMAIDGLGHPLALRELAELSILLGVADPPYGKLVANKGQLSTAQVIDWEKRRLEKVEQLPT